MKFEIINPSDPYTMEAPDLEIAAVAVSFLGDGKYPLSGMGQDKGQDVPAFLFGGHDEWFTAKFGKSFEDTATYVMKQRGEELATALDSVTLNAYRRTSMNNIKDRAQALSHAVRQRVASEKSP